MLGLGLNIKGSLIPSAGFVDPLSINGLVMWLKHDTGMVGHLGGTSATGLGDNENVISWSNALPGSLQGGVSQTQNWNRPKWKLTTYGPHWLAGKYMILDDTLVFPSDFSVCFALRSTSTTIADSGLLGHNNTSVFEIEDNNNILLRAGGSTPDGRISDAGRDIELNGVKHSIILVRESGVFKVYYNGVQYGASPYDEYIDTDSFTIDTVGSWNGDSNNFDGLLFDMSFYNTAITQQNITDMHTYLINL
jgi:hypothetical protein